MTRPSWSSRGALWAAALTLAVPAGATPPTSQAVSWADCHAFKRRFRAADGAPVTTNDWVGGALRPLPATVELQYLTASEGGIGFRSCGTGRWQADLNGVFNVTLQGCGEGTVGMLIGRVYLQSWFLARTGNAYIRSVWKQEESFSLLEDLPGFEVSEEHVFTRDGVRYAMPVLSFRVPITEPASSRETPGRVNVGNQVFLTDPDSDPFLYLRQVLSAFTTTVSLNQRSYEDLGQPATYVNRMFPLDRTVSPDRQYMIWFTETWAYASLGYMSLYRPDVALFGADADGDGRADTSSAVGRLISGTEVLSHEFGHSLHAALARASFNSDYGFANPMRRPDGTDYDWGHGGGQFQEMGVAFTEGLASGMGQYLVNRCANFQSELRPASPVLPSALNMWNPLPSCDLNDGNACSSHHIRYALESRGALDGSADYGARSARLSALSSTDAPGQGLVASSNEMRVAEFACDLLDSDGDISQATGRVEGVRYLSDFTYQVGQYLDGSTEGVLVSTYPAAPPTPESVTITFPTLVDAMGNFCPDGCPLPAGSAWGADYNQQRLRAAGGKLSPQTFGLYLEGRGALTREQLLNLLRTNFMESNL
ncbi:MAG: hypothetical protein M3Y59_07315 [Myxococcota bacterium]|nr:hypothetical protein [Myxococcota bacterium]